MAHGEPVGGGAAERRRRLRMFWRHERLSLPKMRAAMEHHSRQIKATVGVQTVAVPEFSQMSEGGSDEVHDDEAAAAGGERPAALPEPRPQERVQRHTVEQFEDLVPLVQILDVPVPQSSSMGVLQDQILQPAAELVPEEVVLARQRRTWTCWGANHHCLLRLTRGPRREC